MLSYSSAIVATISKKAITDMAPLVSATRMEEEFIENIFKPMTASLRYHQQQQAIIIGKGGRI